MTTRIPHGRYLPDERAKGRAGVGRTLKERMESLADRSRLRVAADLVRKGWQRGGFVEFADGTEIPTEGLVTIGDVVIAARDSGKAVNYCLRAAAFAAGRDEAESDALDAIVQNACDSKFKMSAEDYNNSAGSTAEKMATFLEELAGPAT